MKKIWLAAFRAMDDIKETVRNAGDKLCRSITSLTIRLCDVSLTEASDARKSMDVVLPFLLAEGILSKVDSIRKASIGVVMKLAKVSNMLQLFFLDQYDEVRDFVYHLILQFSVFTNWIQELCEHLICLN